MDAAAAADPAVSGEADPGVDSAAAVPAVSEEDTGPRTIGADITAGDVPAASSAGADPTTATDPAASAACCLSSPGRPPLRC